MGAIAYAKRPGTRDRRVLKFARDLDELVMIKREITLYRLIHEALGVDAVADTLRPAAVDEFLPF